MAQNPRSLLALAVREVLAQGSTLLRLAPHEVKQLWEGEVVEETRKRLKDCKPSNYIKEVDRVIADGRLPILINALDNAEVRVQVMAAYSLCKITGATSEQTRAAIEAGCVEPLMRLCRDVEKENLAEHALAAVNNIIAKATE